MNNHRLRITSIKFENDGDIARVNFLLPIEITKAYWQQPYHRHLLKLKNITFYKTGHTTYYPIKGLIEKEIEKYTNNIFDEPNMKISDYRHYNLRKFFFPSNVKIICESDYQIKIFERYLKIKKFN